MILTILIFVGLLASVGGVFMSFEGAVHDGILLFEVSVLVLVVAQIL